MDRQERRNLSMLFDFYEMTMSGGYFRLGMQDRVTYFDVFFRRVPDRGGFAIAAGLEQLVDYIRDLHFDEEDIAYLRSKNLFGEDFLDYLRQFRFTGDIWAVPEGTPVFPGDGAGPRQPGPAHRDLRPAGHQPPEPDRHQGQPGGPGRPGPHGAGVRLPPGPGGGRGHRGGPGRLHRRRPRHRLRRQRSALRRARRRHHGPLLGPDVRHPVRGLQDLLRDLPHQRRAAGGHLQHPQKRRARRHPGLQRGTQAPGHHQVRHPPGLRRHRLPDQGGPEDAGRGGLAELHHLRVQRPG